MEGNLMSDRDAQRESVRRWYANHADEHNARRRARYQSDPGLRQKAREQAANYRKTIWNREIKLRNGFSTSTRVAKLLGVTRQTLLNWETREMIPKPSVPGKHRLYTPYQIELLQALVDTVGDRHKFEVVKTYVFKMWSTEFGG